MPTSRAEPITPSVHGIEQLFRQHGPMVRGLLARVIGPSSDLDDLVQTTFLEALRSFHRYKGNAKPSTWICGIALHVAHHHLRSKKVRRHVALDMVPADLLEQPNDVDRDQTLDAERVSSRLKSLLDRIHPNKRNALLAFVLDEAPVEQIAHTMSATETATRSRMFFARRELRHLIADDPALADHVEGFRNRHAEALHADPSSPRPRIARRVARSVRAQLAVGVG